LLTLGGAFGYAVGWNPFASDYSRYLSPNVSRRAVGLWSGLGVLVSCVVLEVLGAASATIGKSTDDGATWQKIATGNWPGTSAGVRSSNIVVTGKYVYTNFQPDSEQARALLTDDTKWDRAYTAMTAATGGNPFGTAVSYSSLVGKYVIVMSSETAVWRYIEP